MTKKTTFAQALDVEVLVDIEVPDDWDDEQIQQYIEGKIWIGIFATANDGEARVVDVSNCGNPQILDY